MKTTFKDAFKELQKHSNECFCILYRNKHLVLIDTICHEAINNNIAIFIDKDSNYICWNIYEHGNNKIEIIG